MRPKFYAVTVLALAGLAAAAGCSSASSSSTSAGATAASTASPSASSAVNLSAVTLNVGDPQAERDVGQHLFPGHQPGFLERDRHRTRDRELACHLLVKTGERAQRLGQVHAAAPDQRDELPGRDVQVEPVKDGPAAERAAQPPDGSRRGRPAGSWRRYHGPFGRMVYCPKSRRHASAFLSSRRTAPFRSRPRIA
jgi:hypothetical protein